MVKLINLMYIYIVINSTHTLKLSKMKQVFILIDKTEVNNINGFYDRKEMMQHDADRLNAAITNNTIWVLTPNN